MRDFQPDTGRVDEVLEPVEYVIAQDAESFAYETGLVRSGV